MMPSMKACPEEIAVLKALNDPVKPIVVERQATHGERYLPLLGTVDNERQQVRKQFSSMIKLQDQGGYRRFDNVQRGRDRLSTLTMDVMSRLTNPPDAC